MSARRERSRLITLSLILASLMALAGTMFTASAAPPAVAAPAEVSTAVGKSALTCTAEGIPGIAGGFAAVPDAEGNLYVAGQTSTALPGQVHLGNADAYVLKYGADDKLVWTRQFGTCAADGVRALALDAEDNLYVAGYTGGALPGQVAAGGMDAFVRKYDGRGAELWTRQFGTAGVEWTTDLAVDAAGHVAVVGDTSGGFLDYQPAGEEDAWVCWIDVTGNVVWTHQFGSSAGDWAREWRWMQLGTSMWLVRRWARCPGR